MSSALELRLRFPVDDQVLSGSPAHAFGRPSGAAQPWQDRLQHHSSTWVGAFNGATLVGFAHACWDGGSHAFVLDTAVDRSYQRQGVGRALVQAVIQQAGAAGCEWLHVDYDPHLAAFCTDAYGFRATDAGLLHLPRRQSSASGTIAGAARRASGQSWGGLGRADRSDQPQSRLSPAGGRR